MVSNSTFRLYNTEESVHKHFQSLFRKKQLRCVLRKRRKKNMKEDVERVFFVNLQANIWQLHYELTSLQIIFRDFNIMYTFEQLLLVYIPNS